MLADDRAFWKVALTFPPDKESVYPTHAAAHCFDEQAANGAVLEYGCGGGSDTVSLARRGARVFFVDIVPENVEATHQRLLSLGLPGTGNVLATSAAIPFPNGVFDSVNCHGVLHHIVDEELAVAKEFRRVLRSGGKAYVMLYTEFLFERCRKQVEALVQQQGWDVRKAFSYCTDGGGMADYFTEESGRALFEDAALYMVSSTLYNENDFRVFIVQKP